MHRLGDVGGGRYRQGMTTPAEEADVEDCCCCGQRLSVDELARMLCHPEVVVCHGCASWLATWSQNLMRAVPVLPTHDLAASVRFWEQAGFGVQRFGDGLAIAERDGVELHLVVPEPGGGERAAAYVHARDVGAVHAGWEAAGLAVSALRDEPWDMREFNIVDPGGNRVRLGQGISSGDHGPDAEDPSDP